MGHLWLKWVGHLWLKWVRHLQLRWVGQLWQSELLFFLFFLFFFGRYAQKTLVFRGEWIHKLEDALLTANNIMLHTNKPSFTSCEGWIHLLKALCNNASLKKLHPPINSRITCYFSLTETTCDTTSPLNDCASMSQ